MKLRRTSVWMLGLVVATLAGCKVAVKGSATDASAGGPAQSTATGTGAGTDKIALPGDSEVVTQDGAAVASDVAGAYLTLPPGIVPAGPSVNVQPKVTTRPGQLAVVLSIPLKDGLGLTTVASSPNLVVLYEVTNADGKTVFGLIPRSELQVSADQVTFTTRGAGNYQAAILPVLVTTEKTSDPTTVPILTATAAAALPAILWTVPSATFSAPGRQVGLAAAYTPNSVAMLDCVAVLSKDKATLDVSSGSLGPATSHVFPITDPTAFTTYGRFQCIDKNGRVTTSPWSSAVAVTALPPPSWNSLVGPVDAVVGKPLALTLDASGATSYALVAGGTDCGSGGSWTTAPAVGATSGVVTGVPTTAGTTCTLAVAASNAGGNVTQTIAVTVWADPGTVCDTLASGTCTVSTAKTLPDLSLVQVSGNLVIASGGALRSNADQSLAIKVTGDVTVQAGGQIKANLTTLAATNVTVAAGASLIADGLSSYTGATAGSLYTPSTPSGQGAPHGGAGGADSSSNSSAAYGLASQPSTFGAKGQDSATGQTGGLGGGAIRITASSTLTVDGTLSANGAAGTAGTSGGGGGSGGSLWLSAATLSGAGTIAATGGSGGSGSVVANGGGGAGGRIALYRSTNGFSGTSSVNGGAAGAGGGATASAGAVGSLVTPAGTSPAHEVFASSTTYAGNLGGLSGADSKCQAVAAAAGLAGRWKALLSGTGVAARSRLTVAGPVYNRASTPAEIAASATALWSGTLTAAVAKTETGGTPSASPWTGSDASGNATGTACLDWSNPTAAETGGIGDETSAGAAWLASSARTCDQLQSLVCLSQ